MRGLNEGSGLEFGIFLQLFILYEEIRINLNDLTTIIHALRAILIWIPIYMGMAKKRPLFTPFDK
jgi:hypothetical protein